MAVKMRNSVTEFLLIPCRVSTGGVVPRPCETEQAQGETFVSGCTHWFCSTSADEESAGIDEKAVVIDKSGD